MTDPLSAIAFALAIGSAAQAANFRYPVETEIGLMRAVFKDRTFWCWNANTIGEIVVTKPLFVEYNWSVNLNYTHHSCYAEENDRIATDVWGIGIKRIWR